MFFFVYVPEGYFGYYADGKIIIEKKIKLNNILLNRYLSLKLTFCYTKAGIKESSYYLIHCFDGSLTFVEEE
jgi:hypothetical protein